MVNKHKIKHMKNTFTLFVFLFSASIMMGQIGKENNDYQNQKHDIKKLITHVNQSNEINSQKANKVFLQSLDSVCSDSYDQDFEEWQFDAKALINYTVNGLCSEVVFLRWDEEWHYNALYRYSYDDNHLLTQHTISSYNEAQSEWMENIILDMNYNFDGLLSEVLITYQYDDELEYERSELYYDNSGFLIEVIMLNQNEEWEAYSKDTYFVNEENYQYEEFGYYWDGLEWFNNNQQIGKCNSDWQQIESNSYYRDEGSVDWEHINKDEFTYDDHNNIATVTSFQWNVENGLWEERSVVEHFYNNDYSFDQLLIPDIYFNDDASGRFLNFFNHMWLKGEYSTINLETNEIQLRNRDLFYYSEQDIQAIDHLTMLKSKIFPNPAKDDIHIDFETQEQDFLVQILNLQGQIVIEESIHKGQAISITKLSSGMYSYRLVGERSLTSGSFIKQ